MGPSSVSVPQAAEMFSRILRALLRGPQCPCNVAMNLSAPERALYPFLAELLARGWVVVVPDSRLTKPENKTTQDRGVPSFDALLASTQAGLDRVSESASSPEDRLIRKSRVWYDFFRSLDDLPVSERVFYISLTRAGRRMEATGHLTAYAGS